MDSRSKDFPMENNRRTTLEKRAKQNPQQVIQIDVLPDDVLLQIFDFYMRVGPEYEKEECWQTLVHVCRRWRSLVFQSPRRLDLRLYCSTRPKKPPKDKLDFWPAFPVVLEGNMISSVIDSVVAVLEQSNHRLRKVALLEMDVPGRPGGQFEKLLAAMQVPFPELTTMFLDSCDEPIPVIPDSFLGGSAPNLQYFRTDGIPFLGLPKLLLSANHLDTLSLNRIPHSGYISPEAIVTLLSALPCLTLLQLGFRSPRSCPDWQSPSLPPPKRTTHPLKGLCFRGVTEYLEELVTRIDTSQLEWLEIVFFNQIDFYCPRLAQFISCSPTFRALHEAHVEFDDHVVLVRFRYRRSSPRYFLDGLKLGISCREPDWQLSAIEQICNSSLAPISTVQDLYIKGQFLEPAIEDTQWLQLLLPFTAVKNLYLSYEFKTGIAGALQGLVGGRNTEVLPSLENILVKKPPSLLLRKRKLGPKASTPLQEDLGGRNTEGLPSLENILVKNPPPLLPQELGPKASTPLEEDIGEFLAARQLSGHPIAISVWNSAVKSMFSRRRPLTQN